VGKRFGVDPAAIAGALSLALVACSASGAGPGGGSPTLTPYAGCLPPCLENALASCIGDARACSTPGSAICWDTGARATISTSGLDGGAIEKVAIDAPDGSLCITQLTFPGAQGIPQLSYYDANGALVASTSYDPTAPRGYVFNCDGKGYAAKAAFASSGCTDNAPILLGNACTGTVTCP
jgi:hypothetical protein